MDKKASKNKIKIIQKELKQAINLLRRLEIRPCRGDSDIKQKDIEIVDLMDRIKSLVNERDSYLYAKTS